MSTNGQIVNGVDFAIEEWANGLSAAATESLSGHDLEALKDAVLAFVTNALAPDERKSDDRFADGVREGLRRAADHVRHFGTSTSDWDEQRAEAIERLIPMVKPAAKGGE